MKAIVKYIIPAMLVMPIVAMAQNTNSGYFVEEYTYRHQLNPAFGNENEYVSLPALGNFNVALNGNLNLTDVLYNVNGKTTTFLNPMVSVEELMSNLEDKNTLGVNLKMDILSIGFKGLGGYNTIGINARVNENTTIPKALFSLAKEGVTNTTYDITDFNAYATAYVEVALGHSRNINEHLRIGATLKFLVGAGNVDAEFEKAQLTLGENAWNAVTNATIQSSIKGMSYTHAKNNNTGHEYVDGIDVDKAGIGGYGAAIDLGAIYTLNEDWEFSASVLDLGFIQWSETHVASTNGDQTFTTADYTFNVNDDATNSFDNEMDKLKDDISALYELNDMGDSGSRIKKLGATVNVGVRYSMPFYRKLSVGLLSSTRFQGDYSSTECRLSANIAPCKIFSAGVNVVTGTYGTGYGWLINFHPKGFNLFLGMDRTVTKLAKQGVPLSSNASVNLGINFPF